VRAANRLTGSLPAGAARPDAFRVDTCDARCVCAGRLPLQIMTGRGSDRPRTELAEDAVAPPARGRAAAVPAASSTPSGALPDGEVAYRLVASWLVACTRAGCSGGGVAGNAMAGSGARAAMAFGAWAAAPACDDGRTGASADVTAMPIAANDTATSPACATSGPSNQRRGTGGRGGLTRSTCRGVRGSIQFHAAAAGFDAAGFAVAGVDVAGTGALVDARTIAPCVERRSG
jgi:hypothetical protein